jgi:photosystem II stability/assembly factor-like uncharacterized protein
MIAHRRVHSYCDLPNGATLDGRVTRFESLNFGSKRVGYTVLGFFLLKTVDGGETWRYIDVNAPAGFAPRQVFSLGGMRSWVACASTAGSRPGAIPVLVTEDGGKRWEVGWAGHQNCRYGSKVCLSFVDERSGWLLATQYTEQGQRGAIFRTNDAGAHWQPVGESLNVRPQGVFLRRTDDGYLLAATPEQDRTRAFSASLENGVTKTEFLVGGHSAVVLSLTEAGTKAEPVLETKCSLYAIGGTRSGLIALCGVGGAIFRRDSLANTWERVKTGTRADLNDIDFSEQAGRSRGLAVGEDGIILASTDEGKTWLKLPHAIGRCGFSAVEMLDVATAVVAASDAIYLLDVTDSPSGHAKHSSPSLPVWGPQ